MRLAPPKTDRRMNATLAAYFSKPPAMQRVLRAMEEAEAQQREAERRVSRWAEELAGRKR